MLPRGTTVFPGGSTPGPPGRPPEAVDVAIAICEDLWQDGGPVAVCRRAGRGPARGAERLALRAGQGRRAAGPGGPAGSGGGRRPGLRQPGRRAGRAGLRRRLDPGRRGRRPCWPAGRSSRRRWWWPTWSCRPRRRLVAGPGDEPVDAEDGTVITVKRVALTAGPPALAPGSGPAQPGRRRSPRGRSGRGCPIRPRCMRRWCSGSGTTCARTGSVRRSWPCPAGSTRR